MKTITLRFVTSQDAISDAIRVACYGFWATHVEVLDGNTYIGAHCDGGVQARPVGYDGTSFWKEALYEVQVEDTKAAIFTAFLKAQLGKQYDLTAIAAFAMSPIFGARDWREADSWFCSELVMAAFDAAVIFNKLPDGVNHYTPRDVLFLAAVVGSLSASRIRGQS